MEAKERLEGLGEALTAEGLRTRIPLEDPPLLHVVNPGAVMLKEVIGCVVGDDGELWFHWPMLDVLLGRADDIASAVERIRFVLGGPGDG